jgi:hypothetical protein
MHVIQGVERSQVSASMDALAVRVPFENLAGLRNLVDEEKVYLIPGDPGSCGVDWEGYVLDELPSQFMRQVIAGQQRVPDLWDWRIHPQLEKLVEIVQRLGPALRLDLSHSSMK